MEKDNRTLGQRIAQYRKLRGITQEELGDLVFAVVNLARKLKIDPEEALYRASDKFVARFAHMESAASAAGKMLSDYDPDALEELWEDAKDKKKRI